MDIKLKIDAKLISEHVRSRLPDEHLQAISKVAAQEAGRVGVSILKALTPRGSGPSTLRGKLRTRLRNQVSYKIQPLHSGNGHFLLVGYRPDAGRGLDNFLARLMNKGTQNRESVAGNLPGRRVIRGRWGPAHFQTGAYVEAMIKLGKKKPIIRHTGQITPRNMIEQFVHVARLEVARTYVETFQVGLKTLLK